MKASKFLRDMRALKRDTLRETLAALLRYPAVLRKRERYRRMLALDGYDARFSEIYRNGLWHSRESGSGQGSELAYTANLRAWLPEVVRRLGIRSIVDAPCGDFNWMSVALQDMDVTYFGCDIVASVIDRNRENFSSDRIGFETLDICADTLPATDLLIVRDCLFHLSNHEIDRFLRNIARCDYHYLLTSTHLVGPGFANTDIDSGDFRLIDLFSPPYGFDPSSVLDRVDDYPPGYPIPREMVLFRKSDVPIALPALEPA